MNILDLLHNQGLNPVRVSTAKGGEFHSACPGCGDREKKDSNRFCSWPATNDGQGSFWCRQCKKGGDAIQFLRDFEGLGFREAKERLGLSCDSYTAAPPLRAPSAGRVGVKSNYRPDMKEHPAVVVDPALWREKALKFVDSCHEKLLGNDKALGWLIRRGINVETVQRFRVGLNPGKGDSGGPDFRPWKSWGLRDEQNEKGRQKTLMLPAGIVVPHMVDGEVQRINIRLANPEVKKKYHVVLGSAMCTMLLNPECKAFVVVETELDAFLLVQEVGDVAGSVALGSVSRRPDAPVAEALRGALKILNALDFDAAGAKERAWWKNNFPNSRRWPVPASKDPGDAWKAGVDLRTWVLAGLPPVFTLEGKKADSPLPAAGLEPAPAVDLPESVRELYLLLQQHPAVIHRRTENGDGGLKIKEDPAWARENWDISKRISQLVFYNDDVFDYLAGHPDKVVSGRNFVR